MKYIVVTALVIEVINCIIALCYIMEEEYPRREKPKNMGWDVCKFLVCACFAAWCIYALRVGC